MHALCAEQKSKSITYFLFVEWLRCSVGRFISCSTIVGITLLSIHNLVETWKLMGGSPIGKAMWRSSFLVVIWIISKERKNALIFTIASQVSIHLERGGCITMGAEGLSVAVPFFVSYVLLGLILFCWAFLLVSFCWLSCVCSMAVSL